MKKTTIAIIGMITSLCLICTPQTLISSAVQKNHPLEVIVRTFERDDMPSKYEIELATETTDLYQYENGENLSLIHI